MYCSDFEYGGHLLSEFTSGIVSFSGGSSGFNTVDIQNKLKYNTVNNAAINKYRLASTQYEDVLSCTITIGKMSCTDMNDDVYDEYEVGHIMRWLNSKTYKKFKFIYEDGEYSDVYYNASFNVQVVKNGFDVVGFELTMTTDSPFAHFEDVEIEKEISNSDPLTIYDYSQEVGYIYPYVEIECVSGGNLILQNTMDENMVRVNNCVAGEKLIFEGDTKIITTNMSSHTTLYNDFNFRFPRVINTEEETENKYTSNIPCKIKVKYAPVCKASVVI